MQSGNPRILECFKQKQPTCERKGCAVHSARRALSHQRLPQRVYVHEFAPTCSGFKHVCAHPSDGPQHHTASQIRQVRAVRTHNTLKNAPKMVDNEEGKSVDLTRVQCHTM